jgi:drug/metabolite transporter superfamily protein YnfA
LLALGLDSATEATILSGVLTVGVLLLLPEVVDLVLRMLPERGPRTRLSRRQLATDRQRAAAAVALLAVILGGSLGYLTLLSAMVRTLEKQTYPDVLPGQVIVANRGSVILPPPRQVLEVVEESELARGRPRLDLRYLHELDRRGNPRLTASLESTIQSILALDSVDQVEQLLGHPLTPDQAAVLHDGGILVWTDTPSTSETTGRQRLIVTSGDTPIGPPIEVPAATVGSEDVAWRVGTSGILLTPTAERLRLPITTGAAMYTGLSASEGRALQDAVIHAGLDANTVQYYQGRPPVVPPVALVATAAGLVVIALLATLVATRAQGRILCQYLGRLISIGLPLRWARQVLLYQQAVIVAVATLLGVLIAIPPLIIAKVQISGFALDIPWTQILVLIASIYAATFLASLHASRRLRAGTDSYEHGR